MGRPYASELTELYDTYLWSLTASVDTLADSLCESVGDPLIVIGSGGSLTAAHFACLLHTRFTGRVAQVFTPYDFLGSAQSLADTSVLVCSAGGSNPDVLVSAEHAADRMPHHLIAITTRSHSALGGFLNERSWPSCHEFATPTKKDGFLATNSLLATIILLTRAYHKVLNVDPNLPPALDDLLHPGITQSQFIERRTKSFSQVCDRTTLVVLHGSLTKPAALDLESRYTEAALGGVQVADFRNFAHGRHHWLAVHSASSAVIAFATRADQKISNRTLSLIPKSIPRQIIPVDDGINGALVAICESLFIAHVAGDLKGIDPGRPKVPTFGRQLYHLKASADALKSMAHLSNRAALAIERKSGLTIASLSLREELNKWASAYGVFVAKLGKAFFKAIICDYDGTLCAPRRRFQGPSVAIIENLTSLLEGGVLVAIATGRGKSVRETLWNLIESPVLRKRVIIGYHNCAEIGTLDDCLCPPKDSPLDNSLATHLEQLQSNSLISRHAHLQAKGKQITIELESHSDRDLLIKEISLIVRRIAEPGVSVVSSTHSIDVLARDVSKQALISHLATFHGVPNGSVLCIGDRGKWPGNDWDLLRHPFSLSVDQVSHDLDTCWNLSAHDHRFDLACLEYLEMLTIDNHGARFNTQRLKP